MGRIEKLAIVIGGLLASYFGVSVVFASVSDAAVDPGIDTYRSRNDDPAAGERGARRFHYDLVLRRRGGPEAADDGPGTMERPDPFAAPMRAELERYFGDTAIRLQGESPTGRNLGTIVVSILDWKEGRFWGRRAPLVEPVTIPSYIAVRFEVFTDRRRKPVVSYRLNATHPIPGSNCVLPPEMARTGQMHKLAALMLERLPDGAALVPRRPQGGAE